LLKMTALDSREEVLEEDIFHGGEGYAGLIRVRAEIEVVRIVVRTESTLLRTPVFILTISPSAETSKQLTSYGFADSTLPATE
jgi:hypothetical protein